MAVFGRQRSIPVALPQGSALYNAVMRGVMFASEEAEGAPRLTLTLIPSALKSNLQTLNLACSGKSLPSSDPTPLQTLPTPPQPALVWIPLEFCPP